MNRLPSLLLVCLLAIVLYNCQSDQAKEEKVIFKRNGNDVIVRLEAEPDRLNPLTTSSNYSVTVLSQIMPMLLSPNLKDYSMQPVLVKSVPTETEITEGSYAGGVTYTFEIHDEAVWDDGLPVTGHDFVFAIKATLNPLVPSQAFKPYFSSLKKIEVDEANPKKFTVYIYPKYLIALESIGNNVPPLPEHIFDPEGLLKDIPLEELADPAKAASLAEKDNRLKQFADAFTSNKFAREPEGVVGCGAYKLVSWEAGNEVILEKKENWWGEALAKDFPELEAYPDKITYKIISNAATALAALKAEELDATSNIEPQDFFEIKELPLVTDVFNLTTVPDMACFYIVVNTSNPKLSDKKVRQALAHAVNVDEILEKLYYGFGQRVIAPIFPTAPYYNNDLKPIPFNIEKAKSLLTEAGWTDSNNNGIVDKEINGALVEMNLTYFVTANREISNNTGLLIKNAAKQAGINIELEPLEFATTINRLKAGDFELASGATSVQYVPWEPKQRFHTEAANGGGNYSRFSNPEADEIMDKIQVTLDQKERNTLYKRLQEILYEEQPLIFMFEPQARIAVHKRFQTTVSSIRPGFFPNKFKLEALD